MEIYNPATDDLRKPSDKGLKKTSEVLGKTDFDTTADDLGLPIGDPAYAGKKLLHTVDVVAGGPIVRNIMDTEPVTPETIGAGEEDMGKSSGSVRGALRDIGRDIGEVGFGGFSPEDAGGEYELTPELMEEVVPLAAELGLYAGVGAGIARGVPLAAKEMSKGLKKTAEIMPEVARAGKAQLVSEVGAVEIGGPKKPIKPATPKTSVDVQGIDIRKFETAEDIQQFIKKEVQPSPGEMLKAKRGRISHKETKALADDLGMTKEQLLRRNKGKAFNDSEAVAARQLLHSSAEELDVLAQKAVGGSDEDLVNLIHAMRRNVAIQTQVGAIEAEAGRALQSFRIPAGPVKMRQRYMKQMIESLGGREITEEIAQKLAIAADAGPESVIKFITDMSNPKFKDKIYEAWINALLSGPTTHLVNTTSNALFYLQGVGESAVAAGIDVVRVAATKGAQRERFFSEVPSRLFGSWVGGKSGVRKALHVLKHGISPEDVTKLEMGRTYVPAIKGFKGKVVRTPGKFLVAMDEFFKAVSYESEMYAQALRLAKKQGAKGKEIPKKVVEFLKAPTQGMVDTAKKEATYRTFQKELGSFGKWVTRGKTEHPLMGYVIPFVRTPTNIAKAALERTPLNFPRIVWKARKGTLKGAEITDELAKTLMGSAVQGYIVKEVLEGNITGGAPKNKAEREAYYRAGYQPYSIKIGDRYYSYSRFEPIGMIFGLAADFTEIQSSLDDKEYAEHVVALAQAFAKNITSKTFVRGLSDAVNAISDPERYGMKWVRGFVGSAVPAVVAQTGRAIDPTLRRTDDIWSSVKSRIPGLAQTVPERLDLWGRPVVLEQPWPAPFSPIKKKTINPDLVDQEIVRLEMRMGMPTDKIRGVKLTSEQYTEYIKLAGSDAKKRLDTYVNSSDWKGRSDTAKKKIIKTVVSRTRDVARVVMLRNHQDLLERVREKLNE